jgi:hypothetical protein
MSGKNTALLYPTRGGADAAIDTLRAKILSSASAARIGLAAMTAPDQAPPTAPLAEFPLNSWPNSGFRNSRRRGTGGG